MRAILEAAHAGESAAQRMILLPPAYGEPEDFVRAGFATAVRSRGIELDLVLLDLELRSVTDRDFVARLHLEQLLPARAAGCRTLWLGGISLGGYAALVCAERYSRDIDGLCLFAPYLGSHIVTGEIERAGGVERWEPAEIRAADEERRVWRFIKTHARGARPLHLGSGREDRFGMRHRLMAAALAPESVDVVPGGHDWPVWLTLWERFLDVRFANPRE